MRGRISFSTITLNSDGTPGVKNIRQRLSLTAKPQAVPTGLSISSALAGISACLRLLGAITRPRSLKKRSINASHSSCIISDSPFAVAAASALRSSLVGPRPPFTIRISAWVLRSRRIATRSSRLSPTVLRRVSGIPCWKQKSASQAAFVSTICPDKTSSPVDSISTVIITFSNKKRTSHYNASRGFKKRKTGAAVSPRRRGIRTMRSHQRTGHRPRRCRDDRLYPRGSGNDNLLRY